MLITKKRKTQKGELLQCYGPRSECCPVNVAGSQEKQSKLQTHWLLSFLLRPLLPPLPTSPPNRCLLLVYYLFCLHSVLGKKGSESALNKQTESNLFPLFNAAVYSSSGFLFCFFDQVVAMGGSGTLISVYPEELTFLCKLCGFLDIFVRIAIG